jgi:hypothetical protein
MKLEGELDSLERALNEAPRGLGELERLLAAISPGAALDDPAVLDQIPANYQPQCREFCALAALCKKKALAAGNPVVLGPQAREELAAAGSLGRALELLRSMGVPPTGPQEARLQRRLQEALSHYRTLVPHAR